MSDLPPAGYEAMGWTGPEWAVNLVIILGVCCIILFLRARSRRRG